MNAKQFAWLYLVENGMACREPSYYGGFDFSHAVRKRFPDAKKYDYRGEDEVKKAYLTDIKKFGVNWYKTDAPLSKSFSIFTDTFHDPDDEEFLIGVLVLNDKSEQEWCAEAIQVTNVFEMMAEVAKAKDKFENIFGKG